LVMKMMMLLRVSREDSMNEQRREQQR